MATTSTSRIKIFTVDQDKVVNALVATGRTDYRYAIAHLVPLVNRLEIQRKVQNPHFYERLKRDLFKGCLMPPITLAFVRKTPAGLKTPASFQKYVQDNISHAFVLDGIQRLSTLKRAYDENKGALDSKQPLFVNVIVCRSMDNLLYRMITLNNGQRPMTTRHQIEILSANTFSSSNGDIVLSTEKSGARKRRGVFAQADFVLGYMAFLSNSITVDSQKLIQEKLDQLIADKILERDPSISGVEFGAVTGKIAEFCELPSLDAWFKVSNNLIGFCAGARQGFGTLKDLDAGEFKEYVGSIEEALGQFDISKIKLGRIRRSAVSFCIRNIEKLRESSVSDLTAALVELAEQ